MGTSDGLPFNERALAYSSNRSATSVWDDMEVDDEDCPQPPPTRAEKGREEAPPSRKMAKGRCRATSRDKEGDEPRDRYREVEEEHSSLLNLLE